MKITVRDKNNVISANEYLKLEIIGEKNEFIIVADGRQIQASVNGILRFSKKEDAMTWIKTYHSLA